MSVFKDFQKAWCQRFPECDLPKAWEDDVRGNLEKHRHKVALLREELEKEEFYVNYLKTLLEDANKSKESSPLSEDQDSINDVQPVITSLTTASITTKVDDEENDDDGDNLIDNNKNSYEASSQVNNQSSTSHQRISSSSYHHSNHSHNQASNRMIKDEDGPGPSNADQYVTVITVPSYGEIRKNNANNSNNSNNTANSTDPTGLNNNANPSNNSMPGSQFPEKSSSFNDIREQFVNNHAKIGASASGSSTNKEPNSRECVNEIPCNKIDNNLVADEAKGLRKKRPPTPPKKPKINRSVLPGFPFRSGLQIEGLPLGPPAQPPPPPPVHPPSLPLPSLEPDNSNNNVKSKLTQKHQQHQQQSQLTRSSDSYGSINKPSLIESMGDMRISTGSDKGSEPCSDNLSVRSFPFSSRDSLTRLSKSSLNQSPPTTYPRGGHGIFGSSIAKNSSNRNSRNSSNSNNNQDNDNPCIISKPGQIVHISDNNKLRGSREENLSSLGTSHDSLERYDSGSISDLGAKFEPVLGSHTADNQTSNHNYHLHHHQKQQSLFSHHRVLSKDNMLIVDYDDKHTIHTDDDGVGETEEDEPEEEDDKAGKGDKLYNHDQPRQISEEEDVYDEPPKSSFDEEDYLGEPREEGSLDEEEEAIYDTVAPDEASIDDNHSNEDDYTLAESGGGNIIVGSSERQGHSGNNYRPDRDSSLTNLTGSKQYGEVHSFANYVNIDYFLRREETSSKNDSDDNETQMSRSMSSDHDLDADDSLPSVPCAIERTATSNHSSGTTYDEVFEPGAGDSETENYYGISDTEHNNTLDSQDSENGQRDILDNDEENKSEAERLAMYKCILSSIVDSETVYVDCLNTLLQYKKALKSTTESAHPLLSSIDLDAIFHKISDLYNIHSNFLDGVKKLAASQQQTQQSQQSLQSQSSDSGIATLGDLFKILASRLGAYSAYLKNYRTALETVQRCSSANNQFAEITRAIKLSSMKGQSTTLEELLHKPVARVQKNALILHDLLKYTPENSQEYKSLKTALKMTQCFLNELNIAATEQMFPVQDKTQRRLVKESFIIEAPEGRRKLRHLFLFNDTIVCAKYKPSTRQKFTFDVKWYALLCDITLPEVEDSPMISVKEKEINTEIRNLRSKVSSIRDAILKEKSKSNSKLLEKLKKKQADIEGQLVLILPQLPFVISHKSGKSYAFYLSSEFERTQWIESIRVLQQSAASASHDTVNFSEIQAWIETCRKGLNPSLGSFLMRSSKDEDLLHGDLYLTIGILKGIVQPADLFLVIEVDTYGHFFQRASTKILRGLYDYHFNQDFSLDLDGSSTLRFILYEEVNSHSKPLLRGKATLELGRSWLKDKFIAKELIFSECKLSISLKFVSSEVSTMRFPAGKVYGAFGVSISQVTKKEKSSIPYLIVGCVKEVERRGVKEVGIYRVSGLSSDIQRLKRAFETNPYEAEHLLKEIDINAITGLLKMYLRELPEALFTNSLYKKFFDAFSLTNQEERRKRLTDLYTLLPPVNQNTINFLIDHFVNVNQYENLNKMSLHNLATVFGPTLIRPGSTSPGTNNTDTFTAGTIDVMAQAGILYFFLKKRASELGSTSL